MKAMTWCGLLVSLMVLSCIGLFDNGFDEALFRKERTAWEAQGLRHYRFVTTLVSDAVYWGPSAEITVFPDREPELIVSSSDDPLWTPSYGETIDEFYQYIEECVADSGWGEYFEVRYNKQYHYPIYYSSRMKDSSWVGSGQEIKITEFEPLGE
jgi:hypothetical protein